MTRQRRLALGLLLAGSAFTAAAWLAPGFDVAYGAEAMHIALQAIVGTVSAGVGWLAWSRFTRHRRLGDLATAFAFGVLLVGASIFAFAVPTLLNHELLHPYAAWTSSSLVLLAAALLAIGVALGGRRISVREGLLFLAAVTTLAGAAAVAGILLGRHLGLPLDPALSPVGRGHRPYPGSGTLLVLSAVTAALMFATAAISVHKRRDGDDVLLGWLGPALVVSGLAWTNYALFPSLYSYWVYSGDILQLAFCLLLVVGIGLELRASVERAIELAVLEERRRLARDLHDGVAQELAFVLTGLRELPDDLPSIQQIRSAADRGLYEARRAIEALTTPLHRPLADSLAAAAEELAARVQLPIALDLDPALRLPSGRSEAALRVMREAILNAARHGKPTVVHVDLFRLADGRTRLRVADDGSGIDPARVGQGFGLTSMRERAETTGGGFAIDTSPGGGTVICVTWPSEPALDSPPPRRVLSKGGGRRAPSTCRMQEQRSTSSSHPARGSR